MSARSFTLDKRRQGNITVEQTADGVDVILHKTVIASYNNATGAITLSTGGWHTTTTKTAINRALGLFGFNARVQQIKGFWYVYSEGFKDGMTIEREA